MVHGDHCCAHSARFRSQMLKSGVTCYNQTQTPQTSRSIRQASFFNRRSKRVSVQTLAYKTCAPAGQAGQGAKVLGVPFLACKTLAFAERAGRGPANRGAMDKKLPVSNSRMTMLIPNLHSASSPIRQTNSAISKLGLTSRPAA